MTFAKIVPMAFVMVAGPQIISAVMLATSERARVNSVSYVTGAMISSIVGTSALFLLSEALNLSPSEGGSKTFAAWIFVVLLTLLAIRVFLKRKETTTPAWMGKLQGADPGFSIKLGLLLFIAMPTNIISEATVGGYLSTHDESLVAAIPFWLLTGLLISLPLLVLLVMGGKAQEALPRLREWMAANSWIVSEIVILFFLVMELKDALS